MASTRRLQGVGIYENVTSGFGASGSESSTFYFPLRIPLYARGASCFAILASAFDLWRLYWTHHG